MVDVIRMNMAFHKGGETERAIFKWLRENKKGMTKNVAVLGDLPGPKIRLGGVGGAIKVSKGEHFDLYFRKRNEVSKSKRAGASVLVNDKPFEEVVKKINEYDGIGDYIGESIRNNKDVVISIADGSVILKAVGESEGVVECEVEKEGEIKDHKGVTIKRAELDAPSFEQRDKEALRFLLDEGGDFLGFVGVSFVKDAEDVLKVRKYIEDYFFEKLKKEIKGKSFEEIKNILTFEPASRAEEKGALRKEARLRAPAVIAKIETKQAWRNIDEIIDVADGIMVARGDLGLQVDPQEVPSIQKKIIKLCNLRGKPVITATEMLSSMENNPEPTRAESTDVFNAILDGTDAVMLSGETSSGKYPAHAVRMMVNIAEQAEEYFEQKGLSTDLRKSLDTRRFEEISSGSASLLNDKERRFESRIYEAAVKIPDTTGKEKEWYQWIEDFYSQKLLNRKRQRIMDSISESSCILSLSEEGDGEGENAAIVASTLTGRTARMISRFRPSIKAIIGVVHDIHTAKKLVLSSGVYPLNIGKEKNGEKYSNMDEMFEEALKLATEEGRVQRGDKVIFIGGTPLWTVEEANLIQIHAYSVK
nr:pyruvate kinase [uncultured archaeon GZfos3D4]